MSASISVKLAMNIPINIDGYGAFSMNNEATSNTYSMLLTFRRDTATEEVKKEAYIGQQENSFEWISFLQNLLYYLFQKNKFMGNPILTDALTNDDEVTHVVTHIEYGSELYITLEFEC